MAKKRPNMAKNSPKWPFVDPQIAKNGQNYQKNPKIVIFACQNGQNYLKNPLQFSLYFMVQVITSTQSALKIYLDPNC